MTPPRSDTGRAAARILVVTLVLAALVATIRVVRDTSPEVRLPDDPDVVTCERTLPDAPTTQQAIEQIDPVGLVSSTEVLECPDAFDRQVVIYVGEVVGDVLHRDDGAWLLVNDDDYALEVGPLRGHRDYRGGNSGLAVWVPDPVPDLRPGNTDQRGSIIRVQGRILRSDPADGGGLTLRALSGTTVTVVQEAQRLDQPVHRGQAVAAVVFALLALGITVLTRRADATR